jgi:hypothetical protein
MKVLITGDSHTGPLQEGRALLQKADKPNSKIQLSIRALGSGHLLPTPFFLDRQDHAELVASEYRARFERLPAADSDLDWIGFSGPLHTMRVWRHDWRPWSCGPNIGQGTPVSAGLVRQIIDDDAGQAIEFCRVLRRTHRVFVVEAPRPFRRHPAVALNGAERVAWLDGQYREQVIQRLAALDVPTVRIDPACVDADGFMLPSLEATRRGDFHHANAEFGFNMIKRIRAFLRKAHRSELQG